VLSPLTATQAVFSKLETKVWRVKQVPSHDWGFNMNDVKIPKIVIVGGGAGGLRLATKLARTVGKKKRAAITLIDETLSHMWKPSLHEFAAGTKGADSEISFLEHSNRYGYKFRLGRLSGIDPEKRLVNLAAVTNEDSLTLAPDRQIAFDYLIIAIGSRSNDFDCKGVAEHCWFLDTPGQAKRLQTQILNLCLRLETGALGTDRTKLNVCIVGGGATGVELAAELREATAQLGMHGIDKLQREDSFNISLIEAGPRLLSALPEALSATVEKRLTDLDIDVKSSARVAEVTKDAVILADGTRIPSELTIWAAGIMAPDAISAAKMFETGSLGRMKVLPTLQTTKFPFIFGIGDCAECDWPEKAQKLPPRAQVAAQQADFMARQIIRAIDGKTLTAFRYVDRGSLVSISNSTAVGAVMGKSFGTLTFEGWFARMGYRYLHFAHEAGVQGTTRAVFRLALSKAMKRVRPQLKLH
jgi:NADH:ubiquinone reductase (H+-translocating)